MGMRVSALTAALVALEALVLRRVLLRKCVDLPLCMTYHAGCRLIRDVMGRVARDPGVSLSGNGIEETDDGQYKDDENYGVFHAYILS